MLLPLARPFRSVSVVTGIVIALLAAGCENEPPPPPPTPGADLLDLLPADGEVGPWRQIDPPRFVNQEQLRQVIPADTGPLQQISWKAIGKVRAAYGIPGSHHRDRVILLDLFELPDETTAHAIVSNLYEVEAQTGPLGETSLWKSKVIRPAVAARPAEDNRPAVTARPAVMRASMISAKAHLIVVAQTDLAMPDWVNDLKLIVKATVRNIHTAQPTPPAVQQPRPPQPVPPPPPTRPAPTPPPTTWPDQDETGPIVG